MQDLYRSAKQVRMLFRHFLCSLMPITMVYYQLYLSIAKYTANVLSDAKACSVINCSTYAGAHFLTDKKAY